MINELLWLLDWILNQDPLVMNVELMKVLLFAMLNILSTSPVFVENLLFMMVLFFALLILNTRNVPITEKFFKVLLCPWKRANAVPKLEEMEMSS